MQVLVYEDDMSYIIEPYGIEDEITFWCSAYATRRLWDAGWEPYTQPRISRYLFAHLWQQGEIREWPHKPLDT